MAKIPPPLPDNSGQETPMELILLLLKLKCEKEELAYGLLFYGVNVKRMKADIKHFDQKLDKGWRKAFIGSAMSHWLQNRARLDINFDQDQCIIRMDS